MVSLSFEQLPLFEVWLAQKLDIPKLLPNSKTIAAIRDGRIVGVAAYSHYIGTDCWMSIAGERGWLTREIIPPFFKYPFDQLGCRRISAFCKASNTHAIKFAEKFGFVQEGRFRNYFEDGNDLIPLGLLKKDCKWVS